MCEECVYAACGAAPKCVCVCVMRCGEGLLAGLGMSTRTCVPHNMRLVSIFPHPPDGFHRMAGWAVGRALREGCRQ